MSVNIIKNVVLFTEMVDFCMHNDKFEINPVFKNNADYMIRHQQRYFILSDGDS